MSYFQFAKIVIVNNYDGSTKMPKNERKKIENILKSRKILVIFKKYLKRNQYLATWTNILNMFPIFWHFCTAILYVGWNFHNHNIVPSYIFWKLKIRRLFELSVLGKSSHMCVQLDYISFAWWQNTGMVSPIFQNVKNLTLAEAEVCF